MWNVECHLSSDVYMWIAGFQYYKIALDGVWPYFNRPQFETQFHKFKVWKCFCSVISLSLFWGLHFNSTKHPHCYPMWALLLNLTQLIILILQHLFYQVPLQVFLLSHTLSFICLLFVAVCEYMTTVLHVLAFFEQSCKMSIFLHRYFRQSFTQRKARKLRHI